MKTMAEYVEMARKAERCQYIDERFLDDGKQAYTHYYLYWFDWLTISQPNDLDDLKFDSIDEMISHRFEDGTCLKDHLDKYDEIPTTGYVFGDQYILD